jgi:hypothetical protein
MEAPPGRRKLKNRKRQKDKISRLTPEHKIQELDLEPIKYKLIKEQNWTIDKADKVEKLYKTYLLLFALYPHEEHVPTQDIDDMWHGHILDTQKYMADCQDIFGYYLHHYPYLGLMDAADVVRATAQFDATRQRFLEVSGADIVDATLVAAGDAAGDRLVAAAAVHAAARLAAAAMAVEVMILEILAAMRRRFFRSSGPARRRPRRCATNGTRRKTKTNPRPNRRQTTRKSPVSGGGSSGLPGDLPACVAKSRSTAGNVRSTRVRCAVSTARDAMRSCA